MSTAEIATAVVAAVLVFWLVGAWNRMVALRNALSARFAQVDALLRQRATLLEQQIETIAATMAHAAPRLDALRAACKQADAAREHAAAQRGRGATAVTSLRLAEAILAEARSRLPMQSVASVGLVTTAAASATPAVDDAPDIHAQVLANDAALAFARGEFNAAVGRYDEAVSQFPTVLIARPFGFRSVTTL